MVYRYNKLCPCVRSTRDMVLFMILYSDQKTRNSRKSHKLLRASQNFGTFASEICDSSQSVNNILLAFCRYNMSLCWLICFVVLNDDTDEKWNEMNASRPNELIVSYFCVGNMQFFSIFVGIHKYFVDTMLPSCCYGRNSQFQMIALNLFVFMDIQIFHILPRDLKLS